MPGTYSNKTGPSPILNAIKVSNAKTRAQQIEDAVNPPKTPKPAEKVKKPKPASIYEFKY